MNDILGPPPPADYREQLRWEHTRLRRRMLYSQYEGDLEGRMRAALGNVRTEVWRPLDLTGNPYLSIWSQVSALYTVPPIVTTSPGGERVVDVAHAAGLWPLMQRVQRDCLGLREMLVRVTASEAGDATYRPVFPDLVSARSVAMAPGVPVAIRESVHGEGGWETHDLSVEGPGSPYYVVRDRDGVDVTERVLGRRYDGDAYPYRRRDGTPVLPYQLYHAAETGQLWDAWTMREVVEGSLMLGIYLTYYGHVLRHAAWSQRYLLGALPSGADVVDGEGGEGATARADIVADPSMVMQLVPDPGSGGQPLVGQWSSPADPEAILRSIAMYERRILTLAGVSAPDVTRQEADIRSGYSLAVSRESAREAQRVYEPQFRRGDAGLLALTAAVVNSATGSALPEEPWAYRLEYRGLPRTAAELKLQAEEIAARRAAGMLGPISAYQEMHPELPRAEAVARLVQVAGEAAELAAASGVPVPTPVEGA